MNDEPTTRVPHTFEPGTRAHPGLTAADRNAALKLRAGLREDMGKLRNGLHEDVRKVSGDLAADLRRIRRSDAW